MSTTEEEVDELAPAYSVSDLVNELDSDDDQDLTDAGGAMGKDAGIVDEKHGSSTCNGDIAAIEKEKHETATSSDGAGAVIEKDAKLEICDVSTESKSGVHNVGVSGQNGVVNDVDGTDDREKSAGTADCEAIKENCEKNCDGSKTGSDKVEKESMVDGPGDDKLCANGMTNPTYEHNERGENVTKEDRTDGDGFLPQCQPAVTAVNGCAEEEAEDDVYFVDTGPVHQTPSDITTQGSVKSDAQRPNSLHINHQKSSSRPRSPLSPAYLDMSEGKQSKKNKNSSVITSPQSSRNSSRSPPRLKPCSANTSDKENTPDKELSRTPTPDVLGDICGRFYHRSTMSSDGYEPMGGELDKRVPRQAVDDDDYETIDVNDEVFYVNVEYNNNKQRKKSASPDGHKLVKVLPDLPKSGSNLPRRNSEPLAKEPNRFKKFFRRSVSKDELPSCPDYENLDTGGIQTFRSAIDNNTYEAVWINGGSSIADDDACSWGSSEFESYDDEEDEAFSEHLQENAQSAKRHKSRRHSGKPDIKFKIPESKILDKLTSKLGSKKKDDGEDDNVCYEVELNLEKYPHPELPPIPEELDPLKRKRRHIVATIIESERSYTEALRRLVEDYERPLLVSKPSIVDKRAVRRMFHKVRDILQCHNMFHIELSEHIKLWDEREEIGNIFTASFSKSMVFDVYSDFVNNFLVAMETAKKQARQKPAFGEFLKQRLTAAPDKISLFGLMVKPVQRFPQFILLLQDLLKCTPLEHVDRLPLQLALTELENLTHKLNETKRETENRRDVKHIFSAMFGKHWSKSEMSTYLVRQDDMDQMACNPGEPKTKQRRLFMMNDQLICTTVHHKETDTGSIEKYKFKWGVPIRDVDVIDTEPKALYQVESGPGNMAVVAPKLDQTTYSPWKRELDDMTHDLQVFDQIQSLANQLRRNYLGISSEKMQLMSRQLQQAIHEHSRMDRCFLQLSMPTKYIHKNAEKIRDEVHKHMKSKATRYIHKNAERLRGEGHKQRKNKPPRNDNRIVYTFRMASANVRQEWLTDLKNARLALEPVNRPGWFVPETQTTFTFKLPLFVKPLLMDITRQETKLEFALPVIMPSLDNPGLGTQNIWVCSHHENGARVSVVSLHGLQPYVAESFQVPGARVLCAESVPGFALVEDEYAFFHDTVWMALENKKLQIFSAGSERRLAEAGPDVTIDTEGIVVGLAFLEGRVYAGMKEGTLVVYSRDRDGVWNFGQPFPVILGMEPVEALLAIGSDMWAACGSHLHTLTVGYKKSTSTGIEVNQASHDLSLSDGEVVSHMVKAGVGLLVAFQNKALLRIFHLETFQHLQDVNVASAVQKLLEGHSIIKEQPTLLSEVHITSLLTSKGLLWVGTSVGCTITFPLPRLEGVPQIQGRPCMSYHAHMGPVHFLVPLHCGFTQLGPVHDTSSVMGASDRADTISLASEVPEDRMSMNSSVYNGMNELRVPGEPTCDSQIHLGMFQNKWTSTPDLREGIELQYSDEDITILYENLLRGTEYEDYDTELMDPRRKRRPLSEMPGYSYFLRDKNQRTLANRKRLNKYSTLPVMENSGRSGFKVNNELFSQSFLEDNLIEETPGERGGSDSSSIQSEASSHNASGSCHSNAAHAATVTPRFSSKSVMVMSGGEGHVNWSQSNAGDTRYEDICMLLWQCR